MIIMNGLTQKQIIKLTRELQLRSHDLHLNNEAVEFNTYEAEIPLYTHETLIPTHTLSNFIGLDNINLWVSKLETEYEEQREVKVPIQKRRRLRYAPLPPCRRLPPCKPIIKQTIATDGGSNNLAYLIPITLALLGIRH